MLVELGFSGLSNWVIISSSTFHARAKHFQFFNVPPAFLFKRAHSLQRSYNSCNPSSLDPKFYDLPICQGQKKCSPLLLETNNASPAHIIERKRPFLIWPFLIWSH
jgi:hypothetical protein